ncbi:reverse transcriptase family protein [Sorangium sp. So ce269]
MGFWDKLKTMLGLGGAEPGETEAEQADGGGAGAAQARAAPARARPAQAGPAAARAGQPRAAAAGATPRPADPYDARGILGLSADELRRRALEINPYRTAWIGRVDTIPPQSDQRTALIDRGLILRGLLTEAQIAEIHRVGDLWLRHQDAARLAGAAAARSADEALERLKREKLARKEEKRRRSAERKRQRAEAVARRRAEDIVYLGPDVSTGLADRRSHVESLAERGLPALSTPADLAGALGIAVPRLRWLCFHGEAVERPHYVYFDVPKRSGGTRQLAAPHASLAAAQAWVLREILEKLPVEEPAHGFVKGRSTVTNARPHTRRDVVVNLDLSDFFPTITFPRVRGVFHRLGYSPAVATLLALLCTEPPRRPVEYDGQRFWVAVGDRALPQGACTSPAISNQVARKLDRRLAGMCARAGFTYTRYADDLTFSALPGKRGDIAMLLARVRHIVEEEGFAIHPEKGRIQRAGGRQVVTGVVVNDKPSAPREEVRRLRAILHEAKKTGLAAQNRHGVPDFEAHLRGRIAYVQMIDRERAAPLLSALDALTG